MKTLINASTERADEFSEYLKNQKSVTIHVECRKNYTRKCSIAAAIKRQHEEQEARTTKSPPRTRARVSESTLCFKKQCLFCGHELNEERGRKRSSDFRRKIQQVSTATFKDMVLETAQARSDSMAKTVLARVEYEYGLAAEAKYH